ncbi:MAG: ABC transporter ATP-binding protein [Chloroflexi bacterium]|nr:ABC transporter ATP-binding protein [Chloroflexota bacterium]
MGAPVIDVQNLVKRYKNADNNAVDGISFRVEEGEFYALLGPNGAGKTTTISILTTTLSPTAGSVRIADHEVGADPNAVRRQVGIIFQHPSLDLNLTGEENVRFHAILYGQYSFRPSWSLMPSRYKQQVEALSAVLEIRDAIFKPVRTYSGGMRRKLEIVRSLMHQPRVLFLDEPTVGLDPASRRNLWEYLSEVRLQRKITIFLTTHYLEEAEQADNIAILSKGSIVAQGTPAKVKADLIQDYLLIDAEDREGLRSELRNLGTPFIEEGLFKVQLAGNTVHQVLRAIATPLTVVQTHTPTLEDAYLEVIGREASE